jgi:hypothetical protein
MTSCHTIAIVSLILAVAACTKSNEHKNSSSSSTPVRTPTPTAQKAEKPLDPLFAEAKLCLNDCSGKYLLRFESAAPEFEIPKQFSDFLGATEYGQKGFIQLLREMPPDFMKLLVPDPDDPNETQNMKMQGSINYELNRDGERIYIYVDAGFPSKWMGHYRRPVGFVYVAVNPKTKGMALIFNGKSDLSQYIFVGNAKLLAYALAYLSASDAETERAYKISNRTTADDTVFPVPSNKIGDAEMRLSELYLL